MRKMFEFAIVLLGATVVVACGTSAPEASFTASPIDGAAPLAVQYLARERWGDDHRVAVSARAAR